MCTELLPPGGNPIAVNKHSISYHIISYHITSYHILYHITSYHISYHVISYHIICIKAPLLSVGMLPSSCVYIVLYMCDAELPASARTSQRTLSMFNCFFGFTPILTENMTQSGCNSYTRCHSSKCITYREIYKLIHIPQQAWLWTYFTRRYITNSVHVTSLVVASDVI